MENQLTRDTSLTGSIERSEAASFFPSSLSFEAPESSSWRQMLQKEEKEVERKQKRKEESNGGRGRRERRGSSSRKKRRIVNDFLILCEAEIPTRVSNYVVSTFISTDSRASFVTLERILCCETVPVTFTINPAVTQSTDSLIHRTFPTSRGLVLFLRSISIYAPAASVHPRGEYILPLGCFSFSLCGKLCERVFDVSHSSFLCFQQARLTRIDHTTMIRVREKSAKQTIDLPRELIPTHGTRRRR